MEFLCFRGILQNSVLAGDKGTNTAYFGRFQAALDNQLQHVDTIVPWNTQLPLRL